MQRRDFLANSTAALIATLGFHPAQPPVQPGRSLALTKLEDPEKVAAVYEGARALAGSAVPYLFAYYDEHAQKFVNPLHISPVLQAGSYTLESTLHAFNICSSDQSNLKKLKSQVQLGFNVTAEAAKPDQLTWLFMNIVEVFLGKPGSRPEQLTKFSNDNTGVPLRSNPKIAITDGIVNLQITAFGQKEDGFWRKFFDTITAVARSQVVGNALKGFGIPGLAGDALAFIDHSIDVLAEKEKLLPLWQTGSLEFAIQEGTSSRFKLNPGLWITVDTNYAQETNFLEGHSLDLEYQSYRLKDKNGKAADANYLVAELQLKK